MPRTTNQIPEGFSELLTDAQFELLKSKYGPRIINMRQTNGAPPPGAIRIDRRSKWGNPFIGPESTRRARCIAYLGYARQMVRAGRWTLAELAELHNRPLACWCSPKDCHGHVLAYVAHAAHKHLQAKHNAPADTTDPGPKPMPHQYPGGISSPDYALDVNIWISRKQGRPEVVKRLLAQK